jgi:outer membrane immunogenic protein
MLLVNRWGWVMKKLLLASLAFVALLSSSAFAADLYKAPPATPYGMPPPVVGWTGCYLNAGFGYGMWNGDHYGESFPGLVQLTATVDSGGQGWLGRFGGGCDYQLGGVFSNWVIGAFADYDATNLSSQFADLAGVGGNETESGAWSAGGRIGYLITPRLLTYFDGGYTQTRFDQVTLFNTAGFPPTSNGNAVPANTYTGWFIGGGTEYALDMPWIPIRGLFWRNEYRYGAYRAEDIPSFVIATGAPTGFADHYQKDVQTITSSLVWRFNWWQ